MFSFFYSEQKKMRQNAENWLEIADRVYKYRRDQLNDTQNQKLLQATGEVKLRLKEKADASRIKLAVESLEGVLRDTGGRIYPVSSIVENVEFFLVAAIVILGLRAYFVQPFKIPTNSMWPSYYGMTAEVFAPGKEPTVAAKIARTLTLGSTNYSVVAPADGEVLVPVVGGNFSPAYSEKAGRSLLVFPTTLREYSFSVGGQIVTVSVPAEWAQSGNYDEVLSEALFQNRAPNLYVALSKAAAKVQLLEQSTMLVQLGGQKGELRVTWVPIGKTVKRGEKILSFDILTGDLLFVDRFSYNFVAPRIGSGFVFKTENIRNRNMLDGAGNPISQYYIKRLVGAPGDTLEVREPALYRNGKPIEGSEAFNQNAGRIDKYPGYTYALPRNGIETLTGPGETVTIPVNKYYAMGDNSPKSQDSRYWGFVPEKDVVGRPLFIYFPLTSRWGPAH